MVILKVHAIWAKNFQETTSSKDEDLLKEHVNELRDKLRALHLQQEDEIDHYKQREENLRKTMLLLQEKHKQEVIDFKNLNFYHFLFQTEGGGILIC